MIDRFIEFYGILPHLGLIYADIYICSFYVIS